MRRSLRSAMAALALSAATCLADTPFSVDVSDLWWNPSESGWGLNLAQQNDTVFATMFVYGPDGRPRWFAASEMKGMYSGNDVSFTGRLSESTGPTQPGTFNSSQVTRRDVGSISFQSHGDNAADLTYTVNGVTVTKKVQRLTMKATNASGEFVGYRSAKGCGTGDDPLANDPAIYRILQTPSSFTMTATARGKSCTYSGTPEPRGRILGVKGSFTCTGGTSPGQFEISNMNVTYQGFVGHLATRTSATCSMEARIGGLSNEGTLAARVSADASDLWWNAAESGWGINFQQQDNIAFATLFTYGVDGQPKWYSASDLRLTFVLPGGLPSFSGTLYESAGPAHTTSFNPAAVTRRAVGEMYATAVTGQPDEMNLMFYIDGVQYLKNVKRLTMKENDSSGTYRGTFAMRNMCSGGGTGIFTDSVTFTITQQLGIFTMTTSIGSRTCLYSGRYEQRGRMLWSQGTYQCDASFPENGTYRITELEVGQDGLVAQIQRGGGTPENNFNNCPFTGRLAGVRPF